MQNTLPNLQLVDSNPASVSAAMPANSGESARIASQPSFNTRAEANRANAQASTGPRTEAGKAASSANAIKHGFFADIETLNPADSPAYQTVLTDLRTGMRPANPAEEQTIRELAMLSARLQRLASIEHVLMCSEIDAPDPNELTGEAVVSGQSKLTGEAVVSGQSKAADPDSIEATAAFLNHEAHLTRLSKAEAHLQRAYNRTWDRLMKMQKERQTERTGKSVVRDDTFALDARAVGDAKQTQLCVTHEQQMASEKAVRLQVTGGSAAPAQQPGNSPMNAHTPTISKAAATVRGREVA